MLKAIAIIFGLTSYSLYGQVTFEETRRASMVIGKWLSKSTGHFDFLSATPVSPKRAGERFFIMGSPAIQMASDYGFSYTLVSMDDEVIRAYDTLGFDTSNISHSIPLMRFHLSLGFTDKHDISMSFLKNFEGVSGWGIGYKHVLYNSGPFYLSYRGQYARSKREDYFDSVSITNDLSASLYLRLIDLYAGIKHSAGNLDFESSTPELRLPSVNFISDLSELEYFYGLVVASTFNTRMTLQVNQLGEELSIAGKFSFHFDSLFPTNTNWFADPRYIKH